MALVLVVDGSEPGRLAMGQALVEDGHAIAEAATAADAVDAARYGRPDLIVVDQDVPGAGALLRRLRAEPDLSRLPILVVSGDDDPDVAVGLVDAGAVDFARKPLHRGELAARVRLGLRAAGRADGMEARARHLEEAALVDPATGLPNRRQLESRLAELVATAEPAAADLGVVAVDLEVPPPVAARLGPRAAQDVVAEIGRRLHLRLRPGDVLGRWDRGVLLGLLPGAGPLAASDVAERARLAVSMTPVGLDDGGEVEVRVGVGWATGTPAGPDEGRALVRTALEASRQAVRSGRDHAVGPSEEDLAP